MSTILWEYLDRLRMMLLVHSDAAPSESEWDAYAAKLHELYAEGRLRRVLVFGEGPGPNAAQRQKLHYKGPHPLQTAVVTHAVVLRGLVTALSWFYEIRAFAPTELDRAFDYLSLPRVEWLAVRKRVATLRMQLSSTPTRTLPFEVSETIDKLDSLVTDRLPKLRERMKRDEERSKKSTS